MQAGGADFWDLMLEGVVEVLLGSVVRASVRHVGGDDDKVDVTIADPDSDGARGGVHNGDMFDVDEWTGEIISF